MATVTPVTNGVEENIELALDDIASGKSVALVILGMLRRDVEAMVDGGIVQGEHLEGAAAAWRGDVDATVQSTYLDMHDAYRDGWLRITTAFGLRFVDDDDVDTITLQQTAAAEQAAIRVMTKTWGLDDAVRRLAKTIATFFVAVTEPA